MGRTLKQKVNALPTVDKHAIPKRWHKMRAQKESRHEHTVWKRNPIKIVETPMAVRVFKQLNDRLRSRMFRRLGEEVVFNPKKLVTYQPVISASAVLEFGNDEALANEKKAYVLGTEYGPTIWNGNHRAVAALLTKRSFKAIYLDLVGSKKR